MKQLLFFILLSFFTISVLLVPYINLLYKIKFQRQKQQTKDIFDKKTPIFDSLHGWKTGTPVGGGILVVLVVSLLSLFLVGVRQFLGLTITSVYQFEKEIFVILFSFISFAALGFYDDLAKTFHLTRTKFWGLSFRYKFLIQWILALIISSFLYKSLGIHIINVSFIDVYDIGWFFIPFAAFVIVSFTNAVNITDGLDGLASGILLIGLIAFLTISAKILDSTLSIFIGLWIGALIAFLYFNVYPARVWLGDVGALSFGATLAVIALLLGKVIALAIIGGVFVVEVLSSAIQLLSKKFRKKKFFEVAPLHLYLQNKGWEEPKIVSRFWLAAVIFAIVGLFFGLA